MRLDTETPSGTRSLFLTEKTDLMTDFTLLHDTTAFTGPTAAVTTAGTTLVDGWIDAVGGVFSTDSSNLLRMSVDDSTTYFHKQLLRPTSEDVQDGKVTFTATATAYQRFYAVIRSNRSTSSPTCYMVGVEYDAKTSKNCYFGYYKVVNGTATWIGDTTAVFSPGVGAGTDFTFSFDWSQTDSATTTFNLTATNAAGTTVLTKTFTDTEATLQNVTGSIGLCAYSYKGGAGSASNSASLSSFASYKAAATTPFTAYTLTGPASLTAGTTSTFTVTPSAGTALSTAAVITPTSTLAGTFSPTTVTIAAGSTAAATFTFTPSATGSGTISTTNNASLSDPAALSVTSSAAASAFSTYMISGPASLTAGAASTYTVTPGSGTALASAVTITPASTLAGTFSPAAITIPAGSTAAVTFTFTPTTTGSGTLSFTNSASLTNPTSLLVTVAQAQAAFSTYTVSGATSLTVGAGTVYTVTPGSGAALSSAVTITPASTLAGSFSPTTVTIPAGSTAAVSFTFTPSAAGSGTLSFTNSGSLSNPASETLTASSSQTAFTTYSVSTPSILTVGTAATFTLTPGAGAALSSAVTVTPSSTLAGTFSPASVTFPAGSTAAVTCTFTPSVAGSGTFSFTNSGSLSNPAPVTLTATSTNSSSSYVLSGATTLTVGQASTFIVTPSSQTTLSANVVITPASTLAGTFNPTSVTLLAGSTTSTSFTFTPSTAGSGSLSVTNNSSLADPQALAFTATSAWTSYTLTAASTAMIGEPVTVTLTPAGGSSQPVPVTFTLSASGVAGTFSPSTVTVPAGSTAPVTVTFTPSAAGTVSLASSNNAGLANPTALSVTISSIVSVNSTAFCFSPGNWTGDEGRSGSQWRRSAWNGAWFRFVWNAGTNPTAVVKIGNAKAGNLVSYFVNGVPTLRSAANADITLSNIIANSENRLDFYLSYSAITANARWPVTTATELVQILGVQLDSGSSPAEAPAMRPYVVMIGDSITEGVNANNVVDNATTYYGDNLCDFSFFLAQALDEMGYDISMMANGGTGFSQSGDGSVPYFYKITGSSGGQGGKLDSGSRWNLIDSQTSVLDSAGHWSAYGDTGEEPFAFYLNYGYNDAYYGHMTPSDFQAALTQSMEALRETAPNAWIVVQVPWSFRDKFGINSDLYLPLYQAAVTAYQTANPNDNKVTLLDFGEDISRMINTAYGGFLASDKVHPTLHAHAMMAPRLTAKMASLFSTQSRSYTYF